jgi:hypothetical protein
VNLDEIQISPPDGEAEHRWLNALWQSEWGGEIMVSRGHVYRLADVDLLVAKVDGPRAGEREIEIHDEIELTKDLG